MKDFEDILTELKRNARLAAIAAAGVILVLLAVFLFNVRGRQTPAGSHVDEAAHSIAATADANARRVDMIFNDLKTKEAQILEKTATNTSGDLANELGRLLADYRNRP